ncbi:LysR family transcriptional regulator [Modicisalibacter sp. MOD 31.J]|uniref:LysR family transcriptional regulator n=1 Tax=Modicisalibacter sp. MOD 31.J TaxID=2831897 RepID=UPI001CCE0A72|nr:LysR family transcriptional regulator [Modicisalibacter sp. MOD 31.J]
MLNLVWLKSFVAVLDHNGFQAAARQLDIAQPTLSQHLQKLENQLGVLLVHRGRSGCEPTRAALTLLPFARSLLRLEEQARSSIMEARLRVGASSNIGIYMLQPYIRPWPPILSATPDQTGKVLTPCHILNSAPKNVPRSRSASRRA